MLEIDKAEYLGDYNINLIFNNGDEGMVNLRNTIFEDSRPIFSQLRDETNFKRFKVEHGTVIWSDDLDLAPEYLFYLTFKENKSHQDLFRNWGYIS